MKLAVPSLLTCACVASIILLISAAAPAAESAGSHSLSVFISGEMNGHITPCGCSKPMLGGLPRRATYLQSTGPASAGIRLENGDLTEAAGRQDELKAETIVEMLGALKYDAVNLGEKDFRLGLPYLQALQARTKTAFLCANARKPDGPALFKEFVALNRKIEGNAVRVVVTGVISDQFADQIQAGNPDLHIEPASATLEKLEPQLANQGDVRVLLFHGPKSEAEEFARRFTLFQLVVCAHDGDHPDDVKPTGSLALAPDGQDGKYVGRATLSVAGGWKASGVKFTSLSPDFAEDRAITQIKKSYLDRIAEENLLGKVPRSPTPNGDIFAGSAACAPCHAEANKIWLASDHAHALDTLTKESEHRDPECVACHVVGLNRIGGFATREKTPQLAHVGCEACHGPAAKHVRNPKSLLPKAGRESCDGCHIPQHSPNFQFDKYWKKIKH